MVEATDVALTEFESSIDTIEGKITDTFDHVISEVKQWKSVDNRQPSANGSVGSSSTVSQINSDSQEKIHQATGNSVISWILEKFKDLSDEIIHIDDFDVGSDAIAVVTEFMEGVLHDTSAELLESFNQLSTIVKEVFKGSTPELDGFSIDNIKTLIANVGAKVLETILQIIKKIISRVLALVKRLIGFVRKLIFSNIRFPFIEKLIKLVMPGSPKVDTSFRLIDGLALLCAIPTTVVYKIIFGKAPLKSGDVIRIPYDQAITVQSNDSHTFEIISSIFSSWANLMYGTYQWTVEAVEATIKNPPPSKALKSVGLTLVTLGFALEILGKRDEVADYDWGMIGVSSAVLAVYAVDTVQAFRKPTDYTSKLLSDLRESVVFSSSIVHIVGGLIAYFELPGKKTSDIANCIAGRFSGASEALGVAVGFIPGPQAKLVLTGLSMATCFASQISTIVEAGTLSNPT
jgi:hypothetical protein